MPMLHFIEPKHKPREVYATIMHILKLEKVNFKYMERFRQGQSAINDQTKISWTKERKQELTLYLIERVKQLGSPSEDLWVGLLLIVMLLIEYFLCSLFSFHLINSFLSPFLSHSKSLIHNQTDAWVAFYEEHLACCSSECTFYILSMDFSSIVLLYLEIMNPSNSAISHFF